MKQQCPKCKVVFPSGKLEYCVCGGKLVTVGSSFLDDFMATDTKGQTVVDMFLEVFGRKK